MDLILLFASLSACGQDLSDRTVVGKAYAEAKIKQVLNDKNYKSFYDILIKDKETAIAVAEPILFKIYGRKNITLEQPYECYLIEGYWYISGTLAKNTDGRTFEIILASKDGRVLKLSHGK